MKKRSIFIIVALLFMLCAAPVYANGIPQLPHAFYGTVEIDGGPASIGSTISAIGDGVEPNTLQNPVKTTQLGSYGIDSLKLLVQGEITDGEIITFFVNGQEATTVPATVEWHSEETTRVDLTVAETVSEIKPSVVTDAASSLTTTSATLNGNLTGLGTALSVVVSFEWGTTDAYDNTATVTASPLSAPSVFSATLSGLVPGATYHFRAVAVGDGTGYGVDRTFTTSLPGAVAPTVVTNAASAVTTTSATLNGSLDNLGTALSVEVSFEWGTSTDYGSETATRTMTSTGSFSFSLTGLSDDTTYHFKVKAVGDGTSYGTDRTFTTTRAPAAGGGGAGGAPAYYLDTDFFGIEESYRISEYGKLRETIEATSADVMVTITVPKGTVALDEDGERLKLLVIAVDETPLPPPEDAHVIGLAYNFEPDGASFDPPIELLINYDPEELPENVSSVFIAYYDEEQDWTKLEPISGFVAAIGTATAQVSHLTTFAVIATVKPPEPAAFSVAYLSFSPLEVEPGEAVTITVLVANIGGESGSYAVVLKIDGVKEAEETVTLAAGESQEVSFSATREEPGNYTVTVDGWSGSFTVLAPPAAPPEEAPPAVKPFPWPVVGGIIAGVVIVGLLIFFLVRRRAY